MLTKATAAVPVVSALVEEVVLVAVLELNARDSPHNVLAQIFLKHSAILKNGTMREGLICI